MDVRAGSRSPDSADEARNHHGARSRGSVHLCGLDHDGHWLESQCRDDLVHGPCSRLWARTNGACRRKSGTKASIGLL